MRLDYDRLDRVVKVEGPGSGVVEYEYDPDGNRTAVTARATAGAPARRTVYGYDALGRMASVVDPDGAMTAFTYDAVGNLLGVARPNGVLSLYAYDAVDRLASFSHRRGDLVLQQLTYEANPAGEITRVRSGDGSEVTYAYDLQGRLLRETHRDPAAGRFVSRDPFDGFPTDPVSLHCARPEPHAPVDDGTCNGANSARRRTSTTVQGERPPMTRPPASTTTSRRAAA